MINLLEGVPGSGKSYEAVVYHVLPALKMGRKVITNLPLNLPALAAIDPTYAELVELRKAPQPILGGWDAEAANRGESAYLVGQFDTEPNLQHKGLPALPAPADARLFAGVWDFWDTWRGEGNIGPLFVIDECHVSFPRPNVRKGRFTPDEVIQWFKISRHFGVDVLLITQRMRALDEDVAGLAEMHIRVRKAAFLGKPDHYIRKVFAGLRGGEVQSDERPYKSQYFGLYQSHTQGAVVIEARASDVAPANVKWRRLSLAMFAMAAVGAVWVGWKATRDKPVPRLTTVVQAKPAAVQYEARPSPGPVHVAAPAAAPVASQDDVDMTEPLRTRGLHLAGCMTMGGRQICSIAISQNGQYAFGTTHHDLEAVGYRFELDAPCLARLIWKKTVRHVVCDSPQIAMAVAGVSGEARARN